MCDYVFVLIDKNFNFIIVQNVYMVFVNMFFYFLELVGNVICLKFDNIFINNRFEEWL